MVGGAGTFPKLPIQQLQASSPTETDKEVMATGSETLFLYLVCYYLPCIRSIVSITTDDGGATPSSSLAPRPRPQPQATIPLSSVATLGLPTANTARIHLGDKKKSEST